MGRKLFKGFLKLFKWGFILAVLGVAGLYGYVRYDYVSAANDLDFQIHRARELGIPLSPEEMRPEKVSEDENAAELYRQAASKLEPFKKEMADALTVYSKERHDKPFPSMDTLRPILQKLGPALELARRASLKPHCDFGHDWAKGPIYSFPSLPKVKSL